MGRHLVDTRIIIIDCHFTLMFARGTVHVLRETLVLDRTRSIFDPIEKNSLALFKRQKPKLKSKQAKQLHSSRDSTN